ncbi:amino acid adenylation domain-containing protein [Chitinophaga sp.]|uniref:amino acid adenylation domain-containing protein n=1 Tax=Chitinophaga sp. TaxID=1869181 RepID=UPI0031CFBE8A
MTNKLIHTLIEGQARQYPDRVAVAGYGLRMSYHDLNGYANQLAHGLLSLGYRDEKHVGVYAGGGPLQVVALLACFKAGAVYVPMSADQAVHHLLQVITETGMQAIVTTTAHATTLKQLLAAHVVKIDTVIILDSPVDTVLPLSFEHHLPIENIVYSVADPDLDYDASGSAYVFYTSGSTGRSKGIIGSHVSLSHYIHWHQREWGIDGSFRISQLAPMTFDASLKDILTGLIGGATVCMPDSHIKNNPALLVEWLRNEQVTLLQTVPSVFRLITGSLQESGAPLADLRYVVLAGERLYGRDVLNWKAANGTTARLSNLYGLTETTILKTYYHIESWDWQPGEVLPVGVPITNTMVAVVNNNSLCVGGEIGEIYIKSPFISKGYIDPSLNEQHLVRNPLGDSELDLVWRTGDLGRYRNDGNLEILGRRDEQVKINGVRIELEQVRSVVLQQEGIMRVELVVYAGEDFQQELICYYTGKRYVPDQLRTLLSTDLNPAMLPGYYVWMDSFPLNMNGKVDRKALPRPEEILLKAGYEEPRAGLEQQVAQVWRNVLGIGIIGREDNFFSVGGSSLKAMQVATRVYKELDVQLTIADIFGHPVLCKLAEYVRQKKAASYQAIPRAGIQDSYPLSNSQRRLWVLSQISEQSVAYNIVPVYRIRGVLDLTALDGAFQRLSERHESLRTVFFLEGGEPRQRILPVGQPESGLVVRSFTGTNAEAQAYEYAAGIASEPFDLTNGPLFRTELLEIAKNEYLLVWSIHHIISDEWSMGVMVREVISAYNSLAEGTGPVFEPLPVQYKDYAVWQQAEVSGELFSKHRQYWLKQLEGELPVLAFPADYTRPSIKQHQGAVLRTGFPAEDSQAFQQLLRDKGLTPFMGMLALVNVLMFRYCGQSDLIIGTPVAGRDHPDLENQIGYFLNTLALRNHIKGEDSFTEVLENIRSTTVSAFTHKAYPFDLLVEELAVRRDLSRSPLFDVMVIWQSGQQDDAGQPALNGLEIESVHLHDTVSKFDLTFSFELNDGIFDFQIEYDTALFRKERIAQMAVHLGGILQAVVQSPAAAVKTLDYLPAAERQLLLDTFNNTGRDWRLERKDLVSCFERQVLQHPDEIALVTGEKIFSFSELNSLANQLADRLRRSHGITGGQLIGISMARNEYLVTGILGVLKAGAAYVPLDPAYPADRQDYIIEDSGLQLILVDNISNTYQRKVPVLDLSAEDTLKDCATSNTAVVARPESLAYVFYTSGSTGRPKGVLIRHEGVVNMLSAVKEQLGITWADRWVAITTYTFDLSVMEMLLPLTMGCRLVLAGNDECNAPELLAALLESSGATILEATPAMWNLLLASGWKGREGLLAISGGEAMSEGLVQQLLKLTGRLWNMYGPTETTIFSTILEVNSPEQANLIGRPIANTQLYILDACQQLLPIGVPGELCIAGDGVALGYLNNDLLTKDRFIPHPYGKGKLYRTGDIASWTATGDVIFYGRRDNQIKVNGYRIELGEIEESLLASGLLRQAVVTVYQAGAEKVLVAYYTADGTVSAEALRSWLQDRLPQYMVPAYFMKMEQLPLTTNGKIDRKSLPAPQAQQQVYRTPVTAAEKALARIWEELLQKEKIGLDDNFFETGGHSLLAIQVISRIAKEFNHRLPLGIFMQNPTIGAQAAILAATQRNNEPALISAMGVHKAGRAAVYLLPPLIGSPLMYGKMSIALSAAYNCYGLQDAGFENAQKIDQSLEEKIKRFANQIMQHTTTKKVRLLGFSYGATIAFEIAKILEREGMEIILAVVDRPVIKRKLFLNLKRSPAEHEDINRFLERISRIDPTISYLSDINVNWNNNIRLMEKYNQKGKVKGPLLAFKSKDNLSRDFLSMDDWKEFSSHAFAHHYLEGDHYECLDMDDNIARIYEVLLQYDHIKETVKADY